MSAVDEPHFVLVASSEHHTYVMVFDPRDIDSAYYRGSRSGPSRAIRTNSDSLPDEVYEFFRKKSAELAEEWCRANPDKLSDEGPCYPCAGAGQHDLCADAGCTCAKRNHRQ